MGKIEISFEGFYIDSKHIPSFAGIYCVYSCTYNKDTDIVVLKRLLYIGESTDAKDRHIDHEKFEDWKKELNDGEILCYSFANIESPERERVEAALIFQHQPPTNTKHKNKFAFPETEIVLSGTTTLLCDRFTLQKDAEK